MHLKSLTIIHSNQISPVFCSRSFLCGLATLLCLLISTNSVAQSSEVKKMLKELEQTKVDTIKTKILMDICWEYLDSNPQKGLIYAKKALKLSEKIDFDRGKSAAHVNIGQVYMRLGRYEAAIKHFGQSLEIDKKRNDLNGMAISHNDLSTIYQETGDYHKALEHAMNSVRLFEKMGDNYNAAVAKINLGIVFLYNNDPKSGLKYCKESLNEFRASTPSSENAASCQCIGAAYEDFMEFDSSLYYHQKSLDQYYELDDIMRASYSIHNIASVYFLQDKYDEALRLFERSLEIDDSLGYDFNVIKSYANIGNVHLNMGNPTLANEYFEKCIRLARESGNLGELLDPLRLMAQAYHEIGDDAQAYEYRLQYSNLKDSIFNETKNEQIVQIQEEYEAEKREQEIEKLELENEKISIESEQQYILLIGSISLLVLLSIVILLYLRQRKARERQKQAELEQKALRAQMNPHFLFNSLNSIQRLYLEGNQDLAIDFMGDFGDLLRRILNNSSKDVISIKEEIETLQLYLEMEKVRTDSMIEYDVHVDPDIDQLNSFVPPLIIQPFAENAIWHGILPKGEIGKVSIDLKLKNAGTILCTIIDNGIGIETSRKNKSDRNIDPSGKHDSKGMTLTAERLGALNAVQAEELNEGGTKISILIQLTHDKSNNH